MSDNTKPKSSALWYLLLALAYVLGLGIFWLYWNNSLHLPLAQFVAAALLLWLVTALAGAPLIRFVIFDWDTRYHEFLNRLNRESLTAYLQQFWEKRTTQDTDFVGWIPKEKLINGSPATKEQIDHSMEKIFDTIYREQYGRVAFIPPLILLLAIIFISTVLSILVYLNQITLVLDINATVAISSIAGAYMYVVSDGIQNVRQRSLNASTLYWYVLRMLLAIPIGVALTHPFTVDIRPFIAFGLGALPMDEIIKVLRRFTTEKFNLTMAEEKSDQLIQLEGVTGRISSLLIAEGVDSIEQIITVDPVLLSIHTGLPFKFILHLGSQAIVRRHLGVATEKLIPLGIANARSIAALVTDLDNQQDTVAQNRAKALLALASTLIIPNSAEAESTSSIECLEFNFRQIANGNYTKFILGKLLNMN